MKQIQKYMLRALMFGAMIISAVSTAHAQNWTKHIDWAANNTDAGGSVDCPAEYIAMNVPYAIASGGRSTVINSALMAAYNGNTQRAFSLILLTQCHNSGARQELAAAGQEAVVRYLVENWTPNGVDPDIITRGVQMALQYLGN